MMTEWLFPPGLILVFGGLLLPLFNDGIRKVILLVLPIIVLGLIWSISLDNAVSIQYLDYNLNPVRATAEGRLFATIFSIMALIGGIYALNKASCLELSAAMIYSGSAIGVTFAGDLLTVFIFWELMAIGSTLVIWANTENNPNAYGASIRYLIVHLLGGVVLLSGIVAYVHEMNSIEFTAMKLDSIGAALILAGFLVNAGAPPFSAWIGDAYPEASPSGTVFLSAFTTKTAVFTLLVGFAGTELLIYIGLYMVFYGIIYALLENDMRRILAYSIVNQVGFMVTAIGIGTELALNGAAAHAFAHIIYKALLLMSAGSVLMMTQKRKCTDLGGLFQTMPLTAVFGIIGALAISAFPFTSGFVTKSLETSAAAYENLVWVWYALLAASAGVFLHAGIKFPWFVFFQKDSGLRPSEPPTNMLFAMGVFSALCLIIGVFPGPLYAILPYQTDYQPYTLEHLVTQIQLLLFAGFAFFALLPLMKRTLTISLDFDWFYRRFFKIIGQEFSLRGGPAFKFVERGVQQRIYSGLDKLHLHHGPTGMLGRRYWPSGMMVLWVAILLGVTLSLYYW